MVPVSRPIIIAISESGVNVRQGSGADATGHTFRTVTVFTIFKKSHPCDVKYDDRLPASRKCPRQYAVEKPRHRLLLSASCGLVKNGRPLHLALMLWAISNKFAAPAMLSCETSVEGFKCQPKFLQRFRLFLFVPSQLKSIVPNRVDAFPAQKHIFCNGQV